MDLFLYLQVCDSSRTSENRSLY